MDDYLANGQLLLFLGMCDPHHIIRTGGSIKVVKKKKKKECSWWCLDKFATPHPLLEER